MVAAEQSYVARRLHALVPGGVGQHGAARQDPSAAAAAAAAPLTLGAGAVRGVLRLKDVAELGGLNPALRQAIEAVEGCVTRAMDPSGSRAHQRRQQQQRRQRRSRPCAPPPLSHTRLDVGVGVAAQLDPADVEAAAVLVVRLRGLGAVERACSEGGSIQMGESGRL